MKYLALISLILGVAAVTSAKATGSDGQTSFVTSTEFISNPIVAAQPSDILANGELTDIPERTSTHSEIRVRVIGLLENSCRVPMETRVSYNESNHAFTVYQYIGTVGNDCLNRVMPFSVDVNLGRLPAGHYSIQLAGQPYRAQGFTVENSGYSSEPLL